MAELIRQHRAYVIANAIANKALEHEFTPLKEAADIAAKSLHDAFFDGYIPRALTLSLWSHGVLKMSNYCDIRQGDHEWNICSESHDIKPFYTPTLQLRTAEHTETFQRHILPAIVCRNRIVAMPNAITEQISRKSVQKVCKEWPEIAEFIRDAMGNEAFGGKAMTVPFDALLEQYLALPAPTKTKNA